MEKEFEIYVIRHGQSTANQTNIIQGQTSTPLSSFGRRQARAAHEALCKVSFDASYSSDLERAMETASIILPDIPPVPCPQLREWKLGVFQGLSREQVERQYPTEWKNFRDAKPDFRIPGGESTGDVEARVVEFLKMLTKKHSSGRILVVTHCGAMRALLKHVLEKEAPWPVPPAIANASISRFLYCCNQWQMLSWNETAHLTGLIATTGNY